MALFCATIRKDSVSIYLSIYLSIIIIIIIPCKFFTPVLADGLLLESELQQIFLNLQESSQYSG